MGTKRVAAGVLFVVVGIATLIGTSLYWGSVDDLRIRAGTLSQGYEHACAISEADSVVCWGDNGPNSLDTNDHVFGTHGPVVIDGVDSPVGVAAGLYLSCAVLESGHLNCWGPTGVFGDLFSDAEPAEEVSRRFPAVARHPAVAEGIDDAVQVSIAEKNLCVRTRQGTVQCFSQHGGMRTIEGIDDAVSISSSGTHSCAVRSGGTVACWGSNDQSQLGASSAGETRWTAVDVPALSQVTDVAALTGATCAVVQDQTMYCWGDSWQPEPALMPLASVTGPPTTDFWGRICVPAGGTVRCDLIADSDEPNWMKDVGDLDDAIRVGTGANRPSHTCAEKEDHRVACWGRNTGSRASLGDSDNSASSDAPLTVVERGYPDRLRWTWQTASALLIVVGALLVLLRPDRGESSTMTFREN